uniref:ATP synthase subunit a n=1 Tax=Lumbriclymenella robusta TaxID=3138170 RepID=A0AB38ZG22_9ANNE
MLLDIFSAFDPATMSLSNSMILSPMFWAMNFIIVIMATSTFWLSPTRLSSLHTQIISVMYTQATRTTGLHLKSFSATISAVFLLIIIINLSGLIPYSFNLTSHLFFTLSLGLVLWFSLILSSLTNNLYKFLALLLPSGAPEWLNPFLVLIETTSIGVRPITLSFRLAANMSAGHIVLGLMGVYTAASFFSSFYLLILLLIVQSAYLMFEVGICLVQAYIFSLLLTLYAEDHTEA